MTHPNYPNINQPHLAPSNNMRPQNQYPYPTNPFGGQEYYSRVPPSGPHFVMVPEVHEPEPFLGSNRSNTLQRDIQVVDMSGQSSEHVHLSQERQCMINKIAELEKETAKNTNELQILTEEIQHVRNEIVKVREETEKLQNKILELQKE